MPGIHQVDFIGSAAVVYPDSPVLDRGSPHAEIKVGGSIVYQERVDSAGIFRQDLALSGRYWQL